MDRQRLKSAVIKCEAASRRVRFCRYCGAPVQWLLSVQRREWLLFEAAATAVRDRVIDGESFTYMNSKSLHQPRCQPSS
jgi:hypothetical protein